MIIHNLDSPSNWVERFAPLIPVQTSLGALPVLDLACGGGRHTRLLSRLGYSVLAVDQNELALSQLKTDLTQAQADLVETSHMDLEGEIWPLYNRYFSGLVVTNYLYRPRLQDLLELVAPGGVLIYETFALGNEVFGKPSNPDFLLTPHELLDWIRADKAFEIIGFEQGLVQHPKLASIQRICAVKSLGIPLQLSHEQR